MSGDQLATSADLAALLQQSVDSTTAAVLLEVATAVVQEAAGGQRLVQVTSEQITIMGNTESWLALPQRPVQSVSAVTLDGSSVAAGTADSQYKVIGDRLWRTAGWQATCGVPSTVGVTYTHGYASGSQDLQLARGYVVNLAASAFANPTGATSIRLDDYAVMYTAMQQLLSEPMRAALRRKYGRRAGLARLG